MSRWTRFVRRVMHGRPIIIVSGLPRSGTSMMMKMLEAGGVPVWTDGRRAADDQNPHGYYELERIKDLDRPLAKTWLREGRGRAIKVISSLLEHLPADHNYQVIFMHRDLDEVLASQAKMLAERGEHHDAAGDAALKRAYESHLRLVRPRLDLQTHFTTLDVDYRAALQDPTATAIRVSRFLATQLDVPLMIEAVDKTLYRNRTTPA